MNEIFIKHNPFLLKTDILVDKKEPRDDSDLYYLIYKEQRINKWIKYLPECLTSSFNQTGFDFVFCGIEEDAKCVKEYLKKSQDIQVESFLCYNRGISLSRVKSNMTKIIERILSSEVEGIDKYVLENLLESFLNKNFNNVEDEISAIIQMKKDIMHLFDCEALLKKYDDKLSNARNEQQEILYRDEKLRLKLQETNDKMFDKLIADCLNDITVGPMKKKKKYYDEVNSNSNYYLNPLFSRFNPDKGELINKAKEKFDKVVKYQIDSAVSVTKEIRTDLSVAKSQIESNFQKNMISLGLDPDDADLEINLPEMSFSVTVCAGEDKSKYSYVTESIEKVDFNEIDLAGMVSGTINKKARAYSEAELFGLIKSGVDTSNEYNKKEIERFINEYYERLKNKLNSEARRISREQTEQIDKTIELNNECKRKILSLINELEKTLIVIGSIHESLTDLFEF